MLADRLESLLPQILPGGRRYGNLWRAGSLAGETDQSLVVYLAGHRRGKWKEFNGAELYGDTLDLVVRTWGDGDFKKGLDSAIDWLGLAPMAPEDRERRREAARRRAEAAARSGAGEARDNRKRAGEIWHESRELLRDDPVDRYLRGRGLVLADLGAAPRALRYHPRLWAARGVYYPAMVGLVTDIAGRPIAIHRTFLETQGDVRVTKAPVDLVKRTLGSCAGGSIKLWRGSSGKSWANMPEGETVMVAEGIEDLLSAPRSCGAARRGEGTRASLRAAPCAVSSRFRCR
jgi:hypothetical protein